MPKLGASLSRTVRGMTARYTLSPKYFFTCATTCIVRFSRPEYMVNSTPSMSRWRLYFWRTVLRVPISSLRPSNAKNSHCIGITTVSAAQSALTVSRSSDGAQSMKM